MKSSYPSLKVEIEGSVVIVTIDRPDALNAIDNVVMKSLNDFFIDVRSSEEVRGVIITGSGTKAFVAGADIKGFSFEGDSTTKNSSFGQDTFSLIEHCPVPVIAAINGFALGGGCELAMACHMRIAADNAMFGQPEINLGLIPGYGGTQRLPQLVGKGKALELLLTAKMISAAEAHRIGLANDVVPEGESVTAAKKLMTKIVTKAPLAATKIIDLVNLHYQNVNEAYPAEILAFGECFRTEDAKEGVTAFIEKRKPTFKGH